MPAFVGHLSGMEPGDTFIPERSHGFDLGFEAYLGRRCEECSTWNKFEIGPAGCSVCGSVRFTWIVCKAIRWSSQIGERSRRQIGGKRCSGSRLMFHVEHIGADKEL